MKAAGVELVHPHNHPACGSEEEIGVVQLREISAEAHPAIDWHRFADSKLFHLRRDDSFDPRRRDGEHAQQSIRMCRGQKIISLS